MSYLGFVVKASRALLFPMYRAPTSGDSCRAPSGPNALRDLTIQDMKDLQRSVDYLESRQDIDHDRIAYFGVSLGARLGSIALAVEKRFKVAVLWSGGFSLGTKLPDMEEINYAPRVTTPVLMLNGRDDFTFPIETSQIPMFRLLGTADAGQAPRALRRRPRLPVCAGREGHAGVVGSVSWGASVTATWLMANR